MTEWHELEDASEDEVYHLEYGKDADGESCLACRYGSSFRAHTQRT